MLILITSHIIVIIFIYLLSFYRILICILQLINNNLILLLFYTLPTLKILFLILNNVFYDFYYLSLSVINLARHGDERNFQPLYINPPHNYF